MLDVFFYEDCERLVEIKYRFIVNIKILFKIRNRFQLCYCENEIYFSIVKNVEKIC